MLPLISTKYKKVLSFYLTYLILCTPTVLSHSCTKKSACSCETESGSLIDLKPLAKTDGTALFADIPDPFTQGEAYAWNPCNAFSLSDCNNVAVCHEIASGPISQYISLGTQDTADFKYDGDTLTLSYSVTTEKNDVQKAIIRLECDEALTVPSFKALGQDIPPTGVYSFEFRSKTVCEKSVLSVGSILLIGLAGLLFIYIVVGVLVQIFIRKESGRRIIPNHDFWVAAPSLIKDGTLFVVRRGKTSKAYDKI